MGILIGVQRRKPESVDAALRVLLPRDVAVAMMHWRLLQSQLPELASEIRQLIERARNALRATECVPPAPISASGD